MSDYLDMLASFGVSSAHPGGMSLSKAVLAKAGIDPEQPILDAGCGTGQTAVYLGQLLFPVTALDADPVMIDKARQRFKKNSFPFRLSALHLRKCRFSLKALPVY